MSVRRQLHEIARETGLTFTSGEADVDDEIAAHDLDSHRWRFSTAA